jgi:RimJ/RimL family protein N-acetyltransferase
VLVARCYDVDVIKYVLTEKDIYERIREDGWPDSSFYQPDIVNCVYIIGIVGSEPMGIATVCPINNVSCECHFSVLPGFRKVYAHEFAKKAIEWTFEAGFHKIVAQIPFIYPKVKNFCVKTGFQVEGINRKSILKNGEIHDQWYLGLLR